MSGRQQLIALWISLFVCVLLKPAQCIGKPDRAINWRLRGFSDSAQVRLNRVILSLPIKPSVETPECAQSIVCVILVQLLP